MHTVRNARTEIVATKARVLMNRTSPSRFTRMALVLLVVMAFAAVLTGCNNKSADTKSEGNTAMDNVKVAQSSLSTTAPDSKLLLVQTANVVAATSTPVWQYLFGSPKDGSIYAVTVQNGKVMNTQPYGTAGMKDAEWDKVPDASEWKIDSDEALANAMKINKDNTETTPWAMGFVTYVPKSAATSATIKPLMWSVAFDPQGSGSNTVDVDAKTGKAKKGK